jgi:predicted MPP superfamily phosphohydrolase
MSKDKTINILHLSDIHLTNNKKSENESEREEVLEKLSIKLQELIDKDNSWEIDLVIVSGDITSSGKADEYEIAEKVLGKFSKNKDIIFAPGNHDKERKLEEKKIINLSKSGSYETLKKEINKYHKAKKGINNKFTNFQKFCDSFTNKNLKIFEIDKIKDKTQKLSYIDIDMTDRLIVVSLNTATNSLLDEFDSGRLSIDMDFIKETEKGIKELKNNKNSVVITVMHHPPNWLKWEDKFSLINVDTPYQKILNFSNIILTGHEHCINICPDILKLSAYLIIGGSTLSRPEDGKSFYSNNFSVLKICPSKRYFKMRSFFYCNIGTKNPWIPVNEEEITYSLDFDRYNFDRYQEIETMTREYNLLLNEKYKKISGEDITIENLKSFAKKLKIF